MRADRGAAARSRPRPMWTCRAVFPPMTPDDAQGLKQTAEPAVVDSNGNHL